MSLEDHELRLQQLEALISADYTPPEGPGYSFPVAGQGVTSDQYRQMMLPQGAGIIHRGYRPYHLTGHGTDAETNQKNSLLLKVDEVTGVGEAVMSGFYHRLTEDTEIPLPPVTTTTTYYVCLTFDSTRENHPNGPIYLHTYDGAPPSSKQHLILATVTRQPNQLLTQATVQVHRPFIAPNLGVVAPAQLPKAADHLHGTVAWTFTDGAYMAHQSEWVKIVDGPVGDWVTAAVTGANGWATGGNAAVRMTPLGAQFRGRINRGSSSSTHIGNISDPRFIPKINHGQAVTHSGIGTVQLRISTTGEITLAESLSVSYVKLDGVIVPTDTF